MSTLEQLFPEGRRGDAAAPSAVPTETEDRLYETVGAPRRVGLERPEVADIGALRLTVANAASDAASTPVSAVPTGGGTLRRRRRRIDVLSVGVSALAVVALVTAGTMGAVQAASASPAVAAVKLLEQDEATLINLEVSLRASIDALGSQRDDALAAALALQTTLNDVRQTPDPRVGDDEEPAALRIVDPKAFATLIKVTDGYVTTLEEWAPPALPDAYARGDVDTSSLAAVGEAMDGVQAELLLLENTAGEVREARETLDAHTASVTKKLKAFAESMPERAGVRLDENPDAAETVRDAVTSAADAVVGSDLLVDANSLLVFRDSVVELVLDQQRAEFEAEERAREEEEQRRREEQRRERERQDEQETGNEPSPDPTWPSNEPGDEPGDDTPGGGGSGGGNDEPADPTVPDASDGGRFRHLERAS